MKCRFVTSEGVEVVMAKGLTAVDMRRAIPREGKKRADSRLAAAKIEPVQTSGPVRAPGSCREPRGGCAPSAR